MITIRLSFNDLSEEMRKKIVSVFGDNNNWDVVPMCVMEIEDQRDIVLDSFLGDKNVPNVPEDTPERIARLFAFAQMSDIEDPPVSFEYEGQCITNPWIDPSGRFSYATTEEAIQTYGRENVEKFIADVNHLIP